VASQKSVYINCTDTATVPNKDTKEMLNLNTNIPYKNRLHEITKIMSQDIWSKIQLERKKKIQKYKWPILQQDKACLKNETSDQVQQASKDIRQSWQLKTENDFIDPKSMTIKF